MTASNYAIIDSTNTVINVVVWDGQSDWTPPENTTAQLLPVSTTPPYPGIGWTYANGTFTAPTNPAGT